MADKTEKIVVPSELAVLPVRDTVLFPGGVLPLTVGRESSLSLLNSLQGEERLLAVVAQLDPRVEDPTEVDMHRVGTMATLYKTATLCYGKNCWRRPTCAEGSKRWCANYPRRSRSWICAIRFRSRYRSRWVRASANICSASK